MNYLPESDGCWVCGQENPVGFHIRLRLDGEAVTAEFAPQTIHSGYTGVVHGGVLAALLDEAMSWAACVKARRFCLAAELKVRFLKPTPPGEALVVKAAASEPCRGLISASAEVVGRDGITYARADGRFAPMRLEDSLRVVPHLRFSEDTVPLEELLDGTEGLQR